MVSSPLPRLFHGLLGFPPGKVIVYDNPEGNKLYDPVEVTIHPVIPVGIGHTSRPFVPNIYDKLIGLLHNGDNSFVSDADPRGMICGLG